jgi:histidinol dehydrogenase
VELTERFNGARLTADQFAVSQAEFMAASLQADESLRAAIAETAGNVEAFAKRSRRKNWSMRNGHGARWARNLTRSCASASTSRAARRRWSRRR